jgi:transcriptional regulator with XRE-family HTH domain
MGKRMKKAPEAKLTHPLAKKRKKAGISRLLMARELGVSYTTLWRWECGLTDPPPYAERSWRGALTELVDA